MRRIGHALATGVLVACCGCAGFDRGAYWHESTGTSGPGGDDAQTGAADTGQGGSDDSGGSDEDGSGSGTATGPTPGPSFVADVLPLLRAGCERCHAADGAANGTSLLLDAEDPVVYASVLEFIDLDAPAQSRLLSKGAGQGHTGGVIYDDHSSEYAAILDWIEQGAEP